MSSQSSIVKLSSVFVLLLVGVFIGGCARGEVSDSEGAPTPAELVAYYSPKSIKILPFTKPRSFDDDEVPDGLAVSLRPLDGAGDPVKAYGTFMFELFTYRGASMKRRGELIQAWTQPVRDPDDQKRFWERVTATYEFQLSWEGSPIPPQKKYILAASFQSGPGSERLFGEYEFEFRLRREEIVDAVTDAGE